MEGQECVGTMAEAFLFVGVTSQLFRKLHSRRPNPKVGSARQKKRGMGAPGSFSTLPDSFPSYSGLAPGLSLKIS